MLDQRVSANDHSISRRTALFAALGATALPTAAIGSEMPSPIERIFREWWAAHVEIEKTDHSGLTIEQSDDLVDRQSEDKREIERRLLDAPAQTLRDLACKIYVDTCGGEQGIGEGLLAEVTALSIGQAAHDALEAIHLRNTQKARQLTGMANPGKRPAQSLSQRT